MGIITVESKRWRIAGNVVAMASMAVVWLAMTRVWRTHLPLSVDLSQEQPVNSSPTTRLCVENLLASVISSYRTPLAVLRHKVRYSQCQ